MANDFTSFVNINEHTAKDFIKTVNKTSQYLPIIFSEY